jgi:hypothetical protein
MASTTGSFNASTAEIAWESPHADFPSLPDGSIEENKRVSCPIIRPAGLSGGEALGRACVLLHGLNERGWEKYLPWADALAQKARCAVLLFPISFHMDRAPAAWADFHAMRGVSKDRIARYPGLKASSMANAAISERLDEAPERFYLSGLQAAHDLGDLIGFLRGGEIPGVSPNAKLGSFGYSIGSFLLQCLSLADPAFAAAGKRFLFCGGPYLSAMTPVSKYILDSRAHERLLDAWVYSLEDKLRADPPLERLVMEKEGRAYLAMVDPRHPQGRRRELLSDGDTKVASLLGDEVMPRGAILDSFAGTGVEPRFFDLPPQCTHIAPFNPLGGEAASSAFEELFDLAAEHLFG